MTIVDKTRNENIQYDINWEAAKTLALLSGKTKKYEYLSGGVILTFDQSWMIEQTIIFL